MARPQGMEDSTIRTSRKRRICWLYQRLRDGSRFDETAWDRVRDVRIGGRAACRYEVVIAERHLFTILAMGGHIGRKDIGRKLVVDEYPSPDHRIIDHVV